MADICPGEELIAFIRSHTLLINLPIFSVIPADSWVLHIYGHLGKQWRETNIQMSLDEWLFMTSYYLLRKPYEMLQLNMLWRLQPFLFAQAILYFPHLPAWLLWQLPWMFFAPKPGPEFRGEICRGQWSSPRSPYVFPRRPLDGAQESSLGSHDLCCGPRE